MIPAPRGQLAPDAPAEPLATWANLVTIIRVVAGMIVFAIAADRGDPDWNLVGLGIYWSLDIVDGFLARSLDQETRLGAQMDIIGDRLLVTFFYFNHLASHPWLLPPVALFLFEFVGIDLFLSIQFLRWPIKSPNYFHLIDRRIWWLNWSVWGKLGNTGLVTLLLLGTGWIWVPAAVCAALIAVKVYSCLLLLRLPPAESRWR
ncbi:MAG TPA: CDP-alcohol phosphatidyltransferase family protein [Kofleriaceae bacterium]|jgi:CDP-diacylglycerol--glycerol-3-phosphate 3-phosphatidyltransferase|nr:CDP-alcohol phosphatidyltransferase family protein [Kofleriaceae bacterium]